MKVIYGTHIWKKLSPEAKQILRAMQKDCNLDISTMGLCGELLKELEWIIYKYVKC